MLALITGQYLVEVTEPMAYDPSDMTLEDFVRHEGSVTSTSIATSSIGAALGRVAVQLDRWKKERSEISRELQTLLAEGQKMLADLGAGEVATAVSHRGGRPKGYRTSPATRAKLRAAWARRKAAAGVVASAKKRTMSAEGRARIAAAQKKRWAKVRKAS